MIWVLFIVVAVLLVGAFAALVTGRIGYDPLSEPARSQGDPGLGEEFTAHDVADVRFDTAFRGYRMDQVDRVLDRLQQRISQLEAGSGPEPPAPSAADTRAQPGR